MRKLVGYIRDIVTGNGPHSGTVHVAATAMADGAEDDLDVDLHDLGALTFEHVANYDGATGSNDANIADSHGRFGWAFELNPGPIDVQVHPTDPEDEIRWRFPDESSQVGMGFHSDIGKLGWAAGADCLVWNAIPGGDDPSPASWSFDPGTTWNVGNGSIANFGSGANAGTVTLRRFIGFVGGALFSMESGDLQVPIGGPPASANATALPRWDLLQLVANINPTSPEYGKQTIQILEGTPGAGIPASPNPSAVERRFTIHALMMPAGGSVYTQANDLRTWGGPYITLNPPVTSNVAYTTDTAQEINWGDAEIASLINSGLAANELRLAPTCAYSGMAIWTGEVRSRNFDRYIERLTVKLTSEAHDTLGAVVPGTDYVIQPYPNGHYVAIFQQNEKKDYLQTATLVWPIAIIPAYYVGSAVTSASRSWSRLRFKVAFSYTGPPHENGADFRVLRQSVLINLWPIG